MQTPSDLPEFERLIEILLPTDVSLREMIVQFAREEFRRGYLHGKREMKQAAENAIHNLRLEDR